MVGFHYDSNVNSLSARNAHSRDECQADAANGFSEEVENARNTPKSIPEVREVNRYMSWGNCVPALLVAQATGSTPGGSLSFQISYPSPVSPRAKTTAAMLAINSGRRKFTANGTPPTTAKPMAQTGMVFAQYIANPKSKVRTGLRGSGRVFITVVGRPTSPLEYTY